MADVRYARREIEFNRKDKAEFGRLMEIVDADRHAREEERMQESDAAVREREEALASMKKSSNSVAKSSNSSRSSKPQGKSTRGSSFKAPY